MNDRTITQLNDTLDGIKKELGANRDNEAPIWNASHIGSTPLDITMKKDGWGFLYNKGRFEMFPIGESGFYEHNKLEGYKKEEHFPVSDSKMSTNSLWSSKRTNEEIHLISQEQSDEDRKTLNITLNKTIKRAKSELQEILKLELDKSAKREAGTLLERLEDIDGELTLIYDNIKDLEGTQSGKATIAQLRGELNILETQLSGIVDIKVGKVRDVVYTKGEINKKFKQLAERIANISKKTKEVKEEKRGLSDKEIKLLIDDRTPYGHRHKSSDIVHDGGSLDEYLANLTVGGSLPDQTGNNGKFLTTDGSAASWGTPSGSGDMLKATYDPGNVAGNVYSTDNHIDGTTNKVYSATEKTKLAGIETAADVTDATNVAAAGATMDSELIATSAGAGDAGKPIKLDAAGHVDATMINDADISLDSVTEGSTNKFFTSTEKTKLSGIETAADVTDAANVSAAGAPIISSGAGAPGSTPTKVGDIYIDTTGDDAYIAVGVASSADWEKSNDGAGGGISDSDKGDITVSGSGATWTIDNDAVTYAKMQNVSAENKILGRITAGAGDTEELTATNVRTIINVADGANAYVHPNHSGDVTSVADGATTIANDAVTYAKMQNVSATDKLLGRVSASAGDVEEITFTDFAQSILDDADEATFKATVNLEIGTDVQAYDADLGAIAGLSSNGIIARTGAGTASVRTITGTSNEISVSNGDGVSGNPTLSLPTTIDLGGKTSFEIPNGAGGTTLDTTGEIGIDSTSKTLNFYDGANEVVLNPIQSKSVTILAPVAGDDFPLHRFDVAVTLTKVSYLCLGGTNWIGQAVEMDANGGTATDVHSADITATAGTVNTSTTFSNASLDAGDYLGIETTSISGTPTSLTITVYYRENA